MKKAKNTKKDHISKDQKKTYELLFQSSYVLFFYLAGIFLIAYVHDAYFDIMEAKASFFLLGMRILLPFLVITTIYKFFIMKKHLLTDLLDLSVCAIVLSYVISTLFSVERAYAFNGDAGWHVGLRSVLYLSFVYIILKQEKMNTKHLYIPLIIFSVLEFLLMITDAAGMDLFHFREEVVTSNYYIFYGTIGNANWNVGYLSLLIPLFLCLYANEERGWKNVLYFLAALSGILASVLNGADGIYLSFGLSAFFLIPYLFEDLLRVRKSGILFVSLGCAFLLIGFLPAFDRRLQVMHGFGRLFFQPLTALVLMILGFILFFLGTKLPEQTYDRYRRKIVFVLEGLLAAVVLGVCFYVFGPGSGDIDNGRLLIWNRSKEAYLNEYSFFAKLFGIGPELLQLVYSPLSEEFGVIYNSAHSESIHLLLTNGLFGLVSYLFFWVVLFISFFRTGKKDAVTFGIYTGLIAYFGQGLVNSATILNLCILLMFIIVLKQKTNIIPFRKTDRQD